MVQISKEDYIKLNIELGELQNSFWKRLKFLFRGSLQTPFHQIEIIGTYNKEEVVYPPTPLLDEIEEMADRLDKEKVLVVPKLDISECKQAHNVKIKNLEKEE